MKSLLSFLCYSFVFLTTHSALSQINDHKYKVLFLGNSYTYVNDLPATVASVALSAGDTLVYDSNTIGGYTLQQHSTDATSVGKISAGTWDYVVLQEQSQMPSFPDSQVVTDVFPYARYLDSLVHHYNSCGRTMFYMTWGRKNGDASNCASWPPVCTYAGMDSLLSKRYMTMADSNHALLSPVGAVWRYVRAHYPSIELYQADESHPSESGTYAAACCFYTAIFRKSPLLITFNSTLSATDAANIRTAVKNVVFDSLDKWHINQYAPSANGSYTVISGNNVSFSDSSANASSITWYFGDGTSSSTANPTHTFASGGSYTVKLVAVNCGKSDTMTWTVHLDAAGVAISYSGDACFGLHPNPAHDVVTISSQHFVADAYDIKVLNSVGQVVHAVRSSAVADQRINMAELPDGVYTIVVVQAGNIKYRALVVKN